MKKVQQNTIIIFFARFRVVAHYMATACTPLLSWVEGWVLAETQDNSGAQAVTGLTPTCLVRIGPLAMPRLG